MAASPAAADSGCRPLGLLSAFVTWAEEVARGIVFVLALLPVLAVVRGRNWPTILAVGAYVALVNAALEGWLPMLGNTGFPIGFRIGRGWT